MEDSIVERVIVLMEHYGLSASAFADKIDVQRSSMSHLVSGRNKPSLDFIQKVLNNFSDINPTWLIMGTGPMKQLDLFDIKGEVAPVVPIPAENFRVAEPIAPPLAQQTAIKQSFKEMEMPIAEPSRIVYQEQAPVQPQAVYSPIPPTPAAPTFIPQQQAPTQIVSESVDEEAYRTSRAFQTPVEHIPQQNPIQPHTTPQNTAKQTPNITSKTETLVSEKSVQNDKKVVKIVFFYSDNSFESFNPQ